LGYALHKIEVGVFSPKTIKENICYNRTNESWWGISMAFGINRSVLKEWKELAEQGEIAFLTHYWLDDRFPGCTTVTKVACSDVEKLVKWGKQYGLREEWIHHRNGYPHFDLLGERQEIILRQEGKLKQLVNLGHRFYQ
jgi:hypothetical protein